ncbi:MAG: hypothetical protein PHE61_06580, partial [Candidatus Omnitrophica bacterium]|nr:hypothetical protein [Candidatus Omnitrophota bacterium]
MKLNCSRPIKLIAILLVYQFIFLQTTWANPAVLQSNETGQYIATTSATEETVKAAETQTVSDSSNTTK